MISLAGSKPIFILLLFSALSCSIAQSYEITVYGFPCASVQMEIPSDDSIRFSVSTAGIIHYIWPVQNSYASSFDPESFGLRSYFKSVDQKSFKHKLRGKYNLETGHLEYGSRKLKYPNNVQSLFTMLVRIQKESAHELDTRWFKADHEGQKFDIRLLWADTVRVKLQGSDILCDHYRLDMNAQNEAPKWKKRSDYFMENVDHPSAIRQIWVERDEPKRIIKASVNVHGFPVLAKIKLE